MKKLLILVALLAPPVLAPRAETKVEAAPPAVATSDATAAALKKILRKLEDIEVRLDKIESAQKTAAAADRRLDSIERDIRDIRRDTQRIK